MEGKFTFIVRALTQDLGSLDFNRSAVKVNASGVTNDLKALNVNQSVVNVNLSAVTRDRGSLNCNRVGRVGGLGHGRAVYNHRMRGVRYVTDGEGKRVAVMLDLDEWGDVWQDFYDVMLAEERRGEPTMSLDHFANQLAQHGLLKR